MYRAVLRAASAGAVALGIAVAASPAVVQAAPRAHAAATTVTVVATEFKFKLSRSTVKHGAVTFKVENKGHIAHDFKIDGKKTGLIHPGKSVTLKVTFKKAGTYPYLCTVIGHAAAGMKGTLKVT